MGKGVLVVIEQAEWLPCLTFMLLGLDEMACQVIAQHSDV